MGMRRVCVNLDENDVVALDVIASMRFLTRSDVIREAIRFYLEHNYPP